MDIGIENLRQILKINDDALQSIQIEHRLGRSLNDFFNGRVHNLATGEEEKPDLDALWTSDGLRKPAGYRSLSVYSRKVFEYPILAATGRWPTLPGTIPLASFLNFMGFEASGASQLFIFSVCQTGTHFFIVGGAITAGVPPWTNIDITALMPADYDTVAHTYTFVISKNQSEFYIDEVLRAVILHTVPEAIPLWENNPPYGLTSVPSPSLSKVTTLLEVAYPEDAETLLPFSMDSSSSVRQFKVADGIALPARQYILYSENTSTKWNGLATAGAVLTSHPVPVWGYARKTLVFQADAAGNLDIQAYVGGGWRSWVPGGITLVANQLEVYNLNGAVPIARCVYTPTNADTITVAEWYLGGE